MGSTAYTTGISTGETTQHIEYFPFGEAFVEEFEDGSDEDAGKDNPYRFNAKELDEETGLYYYGARYYDARTSVWQSVDPLALYDPVMEIESYLDGQHNGGVFNSGNLASYSYTYGNPIRYIDPNGKQVDIVVESGAYYKGNVGHVFVSVGRGENQTVYTYGRWAGTDPSSGLHSPLNNGPGVMVKLTGNEAQSEVERYVNKFDSQVFELTNVDENKVRSYLESEFNRSSAVPDKGKYKGDKRAHVIDNYKLLSNNCTTKTINAVKKGNDNKSMTYIKDVRSPKLSGGKAKLNMHIISISPSGLNEGLINATKDNNSGVINITKQYKKEDK